jgi:peptide/nickel transport system permease protein
MITFMLVRLIPGDVLDIMVAEMTASSGEEFKDVEGLRRAMGLDQPIHIQYGRWLGILPNPLEGGRFYGILQGNLGKSLWTGDKITSLYRERLPVSIELNIMTLIIAEAFALPMGVFMSYRQDSFGDYAGRLFAIIMMSAPGFWLATMVIVYPSIWWGTMPNIVYVPIIVDPWENIKQFLLPAFLNGIGSSAGTMRLTRTMMLDVMRQDYIRTAWSKGLGENAVLIKHAIKNAFIPVWSGMAMRIPGLIGGQVITEQIFALPGIGRVFLNALNQRDYPIVQATNVVTSTLVMGTYVFVDISYAWFDPRIRFD